MIFEDRNNLKMNRTRYRNDKPASLSIRSDKFTAAANNKLQEDALEDLVRRENEFLEAIRDFSLKAEELRKDQIRVMNGRTKLEDRMIGILSFSTSIELYRRFLEERSMHASQQLVEQISDLDPYQSFVETTEKSVDQCFSMLASDLNDEIEAENFEEQLSVETLSTQNDSRRMILAINQMLQQKPTEASFQKPVEVKHKPIKLSFPPQEQINFATLELQKAQELLNRFTARQQKMNKIHLDLEQLESDFNTKIQAFTEKFRVKSIRIDGLRNNLSEIERMLLEINKLNEANYKLRTDYCWKCDSGAHVRRGHAQGLRIQEKCDSERQDNIIMKNRYEDRRKYAKKRRHAYKKKLREFEKFKAEVDEAEITCQDKIQEVLDVEKQEHEMEVKLNNKLKEIQNIIIESNEEASFESSCTPVSQVGELQKIIALVSNNENTVLN